MLTFPGNLEMPEKFKVVTGGDQLSKVRFDGAATLRLLSPTAAGRLNHIKPRICELWHLKQDFLEKCIKFCTKQSHDGRKETKQAIELFGMVDRNDIPSIVPENISKMSKPLKENLIRQVALLILENYEYVSEV
ncbi:hypothetical protein KUTeg_020165 [Tegillarca granosa]|uniref:Uncharacterized protein n=1 Tax=Tegillarca granosa TaxID=220873 RepID=A0ABQ9E700_TEGGR|nr:hypothetical protein KUTeg_020165 [Tegillarca granosa]